MMLKRYTRVLAALLSCTMTITTATTIFAKSPIVSAIETETDVRSEENTTIASKTMTDKQLSAILMLNYMTVLSQEINASSNSKLYLDNAYSAIVNNINPNAVDSDSMSQIRILLNTINAYQSITTKRDRLQYIYEQNQAKAIQKSFPNPMSVLNVVQSDNPAKALISVVYMAVDSKSSYNLYLSEVEDKYMQDGWILDDAATENLHESRSDAFTYMVEMCQKNDLDGKLALNENAVIEFVKWENNTNATRRIDFLEKNQKTYSAYGKYWLVLAESYYSVGEYKKCLDALDTYEKMNIVTFRKDHDFAKTLSIGLAASNEVYKGDSYKRIAEHYLNLMVSNIETDDWTLRYLAAQSYMDLYKKTRDTTYLQTAYDLVEENVNYLIDEQYAKNVDYLADVKKQETKKADSDAKKKEIKTYNKWLEEERKTELPPIYQPLVINCELLFGLADELDISDEEKEKISNMLHSGDRPLFLVTPLENAFKFNDFSSLDTPNIAFDGKKIGIPANYLAQGTTVKLIIISGQESNIYEDWVLNDVSRGKETAVENFIANYKSESIKKYDYQDGDRIKIEIIPLEGSPYDKLTYSFKTIVTKKFKVFPDVKFEMER